MPASVPWYLRETDVRRGLEGPSWGGRLLSVVSAYSGLLGAICLSGGFRVDALFVAALPLGVAAILTGIAALLWRPPGRRPLGTRWRAVAILGLTIGIAVSAAFLAVLVYQAATFVPET